MPTSSAACTSFLMRTLVQCCRRAERQQARESASALGSPQLQPHPWTQRYTGNRKCEACKTNEVSRCIGWKHRRTAHLSACSWEWENSKGTVKTASVTSEPRADWAVSVKREIISSPAFAERGLRASVGLFTFHFEEDGFGSISWGHVLGFLSRLNFIMWLSLSIDHLDTVSRQWTDSRVTLSMQDILTNTQWNGEGDTFLKRSSHCVIFDPRYDFYFGISLIYCLACNYSNQSACWQ